MAKPALCSSHRSQRKCLIGLKQSIDMNNRDVQKGVAKGNREEARNTNNFLEEVKLALGNCYKNLQLLQSDLMIVNRISFFVLNSFSDSPIL